MIKKNLLLIIISSQITAFEKNKNINTAHSNYKVTVSGTLKSIWAAALTFKGLNFMYPLLGVIDCMDLP